MRVLRRLTALATYERLLIVDNYDHRSHFRLLSALAWLCLHNVPSCWCLEHLSIQIHACGAPYCQQLTKQRVHSLWHDVTQRVPILTRDNLPQITQEMQSLSTSFVLPFLQPFAYFLLYLPVFLIRSFLLCCFLYLFPSWFLCLCVCLLLFLHYVLSTCLKSKLFSNLINTFSSAFSYYNHCSRHLRLLISTFYWSLNLSPTSPNFPPLLFRRFCIIFLMSF
jgi:hypothetical protein